MNIVKILEKHSNAPFSVCAKAVAHAKKNGALGLHQTIRASWAFLVGYGYKMPMPKRPKS